MPFSTDVNLPKDHEAVFPERCVRCDQDQEGNTVRIRTTSISWLAFLTIFGSGFSVDVPACYPCARWIRMQRYGAAFATLVIALLFIFLVWPHVDDLVHRAFRKWVAMAFIAICLLPWILWEVFFPPAFDVTSFKKSVDYEFRNPEYAREFAELNSRLNE